MTVVGARRASSYGREIARELGRELAAAGIVVVSGLAFGIDACAHRGALDARPHRRRARLRCRCSPIPAAHRSLWRRICERGLVVSELPPGAGAWRWTFPARNRIMAALAGMTVVVEAAERSGSLITADLAADLGGISAPCPARSARAPRRGRTTCLRAAPASSATRRTCSTRCWAPARAGSSEPGRRSTRSCSSVLGAVERGEDTCDAIAIDLDLSGAEAAAALARLEMLGYVSCSLVGVYSRTLLQPPGGASI